MSFELIVGCINKEIPGPGYYEKELQPTNNVLDILNDSGSLMGLILSH